MMSESTPTPSTPVGDGQSAGAEGPLERTCVVTREVLPAGELLRLGLVGRDVVPMPSGGRGAHVAVRRDVLQALTPKVLSRAFKAPVAPFEPGELMERVHAHAEAKVLGALGLARRQGLTYLGVDAVASARSEGLIGFAAIATDAGAAGLRRLRDVSALFDGVKLGRAVGVNFLAAVGIARSSLAEQGAYWARVWLASEGSPLAVDESKWQVVPPDESGGAEVV